MINHLFSDGSVGHEFEVGDRVICTREEYSLRNTPMGYIGRKATVERLEPYNRNNPSRHTTFVWARLDNGGFSKRLMSDFKPDCEPRLTINVPPKDDPLIED